VEEFIRRRVLKFLTGQQRVVLSGRAPSREQLRTQLEHLPSLGLYLHVPFCEQICPYCPYNKEIYRDDVAARYAAAVGTEIDFYADLVGTRRITSFYIGGGTPTTMLHRGLEEMIGRVRRRFDLQCDIHMESHPNHLSADNLRAIRSIGVEHISIGVEALAARHLKTLCRPYTVEAVKAAVRRAVAAGFKCVNVDMMFALPGQTQQEVEDTGRQLVALGVDQVAAYPLFLFPFTAMGKLGRTTNHGVLRSVKRRRMLRALESIFYGAGYERTSTWAFTKRGVPRYCSVTVPAYIGLGASGGSYLRDVFYVNTFGAAEYTKALEEQRSPVALCVEMSERMQRAAWVYWRVYETRFSKADYRRRFGEAIEREYGRLLRLLDLLGFLEDDGERVVLSDRGAFWLHALEDIISIDYISKLWGTSKEIAWPEEVILETF
jgi:coproporphyrinogen III oxidase-like Fe-S oxidoreductase